MEGTKTKRGHSSTTSTEAVNTRQKGKDGKATKGDVGLNDVGEEYLEFENPFGDEFEEEQVDEEDQQNFEDEEDDDDDDEQVVGEDDKKNAKQQQKAAKEAADDDNHAPKQVWRPGVDQIAEGEALEYDPSAYVMYHSLQTEWPCLSFDILKDDLGESRQRVSNSILIMLSHRKFTCVWINHESFNLSIFSNFLLRVFYTVSSDDVCSKW